MRPVDGQMVPRHCREAICVFGFPVDSYRAGGNSCSFSQQESRIRAYRSGGGLSVQDIVPSLVDPPISRLRQ
jgi:hypothetical protein